MTAQSVLVQRVEALKGTRVLCVGDAMLDRFIYGTADRISPEAPIPVLRIEREESMLGGAGNVVRNLVAVGAAPIFISVVGNDLAGREVARLVSEHETIDPCLVVETGRQTTIKTRYFASSQQLLRADSETTMPLSDDTITQILSHCETIMPTVSALVLSDYGKGVLSPSICKSLIGIAKAKGIPVIVDPKGTDWIKYQGSTIVTPNRKELSDATAMDAHDDASVIEAAQKAITSWGIEGVLATRSQDGMSLVMSGIESEHFPAIAREVYDVSGAGDTVVALMAGLLGSGATPVESARVANVAAGIVVGKIGTAVAFTDEIVAALHHGDLWTGEAKIAGIVAARGIIDDWRKKGAKIGFTNGCFDLLHPGHVSLLAQAKSHCDRLVVGLNSDASVSRLKGPTRPVQSEAARSTVLASLATVDLVVIFGEDTPLELITALRPDVLVKGADYTVDKVVGADLVQGWGGRVALANLVEGQSTTNTVKKIGGLQ
jgi:D-beta-D-heptose 7-phosphate kinase/D-beta-D-heptose 1-phosphate adenosyltransferase